MYADFDQEPIWEALSVLCQEMRRVEAVVRPLARQVDEEKLIRR